MSIREPTQPATTWQRVSVSRWGLLLIVLGIAAVMGFYTVTESSHLHDSPVLDSADWASYALCHRISERSFTIAGRQFPLCARCSGMYLGSALVLVVMGLAGRGRRANLPPWQLLLVLLGLIALMGIDGLNSYSHFFPSAPHLYEPRNWLRLTTGMGTGIAMGIIVLPALAQSLWRQPENLPIIGSVRELLALLLLALLTIFLVMSNQATLLYVLALTSVGGLLFTVTALNTVIMLVMFRQDGRATRWWQAFLPLFLGFLIGLVELSLISYLRFSLTGTMTGFPGL
jgi:uncharacterized membrane protein